MLHLIRSKPIRLFYFLVLCLLPLGLLSQPPEIRNAIESIAKFTSASGIDQTTQLLHHAGFSVPSSMQSRWEGLPAYRKIETAYWAAEKAQQGRKLMQVLTSNLASEFQSVSFEPSLQPFKDLPPGQPNQAIVFGDLVDLNLPGDIDKEVALSIMSITKYTDAMGLGGAGGILKYYFNLSDDETYKILRESESNLGALLKGIELAPMPPGQKERMWKIISELRQEYATAAEDINLDDFVKNTTLVKEKPGMMISEPDLKSAQDDYGHFIKKYKLTTHEARGFSSMKINPESFGGVILGNAVFPAPGLGKVKYISWIPNADKNAPSGELECRFENGQAGVMTGVLLEDIYAAQKIVYEYNKQYHYEGEGIGLTGAFYPEIYNEDHIYDSLVKSYGLNREELKYYRSLCSLRKNVLETTSFVKKAEQKLSDLAEELKKFELYPHSSAYREAARVYIIEFKSDSITNAENWDRYHSDSATIADWREKEPKVVKRVENIIGECDKIVLHPVVANLELGRSLIRADVMPRGGPLLVNLLSQNGATEKEAAECRKWLLGSDSIGWKFTDDILRIGLNGSLLTVTRKAEGEEKDQSGGYLNFNSINSRGDKEFSKDFPEFRKVLTTLVTNIYDYKRVNQFAKVMAVVRLAYKDGAPFLNKPGKPKFVKRPIYCKLTEKGTVDLVDEK